MRILTIQAAYFPMIGGAEVFHQKTAEWLVEQGHEVHVATCIWKEPDVLWKNWQKHEEVINGVRVYRTNPWFYWQNFKTIGAIWPLYQLCLQLHRIHDYDLIHAHVFPASFIGAIVKSKIHKPLITTIQGGDLADYTETGKALNFILKPMIAWSLKQANLVHVVSTHLKCLANDMGVKKVVIIPNGIDTKLFKPRNRQELKDKFRVDSGKFVIVSHSRLTPKNGLDLLIKAIGKLKDRKNVLVLLVGGGEQEKELKVLVKNLDLGKVVKFLGYQDGKTTAEFLSLSDVFVRPSRQEGFGIAFIEAMASGLPVIGTKVGGITDIVENGSNGILVESEDTEGLAETIEAMHRDVGLRKKMGSRGIVNVSYVYRWEKIGKRLLNMYKRISNL